MEHWSNINSAYGRLSSASGISPNTSGLSPFDLHVMDQRGFGNSGLTSGLANPLPAHATPLQPARLTSMPHPVNYGTLHGSMTPLFDAFGASGFPNQTPYRPVGQALYSLEAVSSHADTMSRLASVISSQPSRSSLFDADLHAMNDSPVQGLASSAEASDFWPRSGFMPAAGGVASFVGMPTSSHSGVAKKDPPPAHSGSRPTPAVPAKTRYCHEPPSVTQQSMKTEFAQRPSATRPGRSLAPSPPTAHVNSQHFEAQRFYDSRSNQPMTTANNQQYIEPAMHMDLNDVISSDDTSGSLVGHSSFGGCSPRSFSSSGFPMTQKTRTQAVFQPAGELSSSPSCLSESQLHGGAYGALAANSSVMSASYADFGVRKDYAVGTSMRTGGTGDAACGRSIDREESFVLGGMLVSTAGQSSISNLLTVQAVADSTTKPKKSAARTGRASKSGRTGRAAGQGFDTGYPDDNFLAEGLNMSDGKRGKGSKSRRSAESRDVGQNDMMPENIDRYVPQLVGSASGVNSSAMFMQAVVPEVHLPGSLLHSESYAYNSVMGPGKQVNDSQLFFTNVCGNSFVSPNEFLVKANASENYTTGSETPNYSDCVNYEDTTKPTEPAVVDEEFVHLTEAPVTVDTHKHQAGISGMKPDVKPPATKANFLASFVNFLSGKKTETLSSVSNVAAAGSRPVLPKYIPDPLLKKKEETVAAAAASDSAEKSKTFLESFSKEIKTSESKLADRAALAFAESAGPTSRPQDNKRKPAYKKKEDLSEMKAYQATTDKANFTPARPQPTRRAKTAVEEKRRNFFGSDDSSDEELKIVRSQSRSRRKNDDDDYDSDKDPAWKPDCGTISRKRTSYDRDDESFAPGKRNRNKRYSAKLESTNEEASCWTPAPVAPVSHLPETKSIVTSHKSSPTVAQPMPSTENLYQKGSFVIEKKDLKNLSSLFSIWKIDSGRLLQKFEPVMTDGKVMHQAISTYSSWSDDIKENYSAVKVNIVVASRSQEVVEVVGGIKADVDSSVMLYEPLLEPFNIFIQVLLSQSLEPNFLDALHQDPDPYYMNPLAKIEAAIESGVNELKNASKWTKEFLDVADKLSEFSFLKLTTDSTYCQATEDAAVPAVASVLFSGTVYDSLTLKSLEKVESCKEIAVGEWTQQHLPTYHGLQHLKFTFYQKCEAKVHELKNGSDMEDHQLLDLCLQNLTWMKELFTTLECLLKEANSVSLT